MQLEDSVVFVTGANRGLGAAFVREALARGARKVYAAARRPETVAATDPRVVPIALDVTDPALVTAAARAAADTTLLVNNAGIAAPGDLLALDGNELLRSQLGTNLFGLLDMTRAFAPLLAANGGGAVLNVLSVVTWLGFPPLAAYAASKAAAWSASNSLRIALAAAGTRVSNLHVGYMDTDMAAGFDVPKTSPAVIAAVALDGIAADLPEILADEMTRAVKSGLSQQDAPYLQTA